MTNRFTTTDGFSLAWYELGTDAGFPPIILQHGFSANTQNEWVDCGIAGKLATLGRRIVAVEALGHGGSDKPHDARFYGEERMAQDIRDLATHLGITHYDLVGYSMGAVISLLVATDEPRLRRLAVGGVGEAIVSLGGVDTREMDNGALEAVMRADDPSGFPEFLRGFREFAEAQGNDRLALAAQASVVHSTPIALDRIKVPTLLIAGDSDPLAIEPEKLVAALPDGQLALVPGDHTSARESAEFTAALLAFLA